VSSSNDQTRDAVRSCWVASATTPSPLSATPSKTIRRRISGGDLTGYRMGPRIIRVDLNEVAALLHPIPTAEAARWPGPRH